MEGLGAGAGEEKRDDRYMSISKHGEEDEIAALRRKQLPIVEEEEEVTFECTNCSG